MTGDDERIDVEGAIRATMYCPVYFSASFFILFLGLYSTACCVKVRRQRNNGVILLLRG